VLLHYVREVERLRALLLSLSAAVEENLRKAVDSVMQRDQTLATQVIDKDREIDLLEVDVEEECLKILALHQPVANDLRFIVAALKINNDLERIGDLAVNIAERTIFLSTLSMPQTSFDFPGMAEKAQAMVQNSLDAMLNQDLELAESVRASDDEVDEINRAMYEQIKEGIRKEPDRINALIHLLSISRHLERMADHATNIAEDVIYMIKGEIVRHHWQEREQEHPPA
jgi:phosphate transport system protein